MFKFALASLLLAVPAALAVDIPIAWTVTTYEDMTAQVGDTITFEWGGTHNAFIHPSGSCDTTGAVLVGNASPATYTFTADDVGSSLFFACQVGSHCDFGQHITVTVASSDSGPSEPEATAAPFVCNICGDGNTITTPDFVVSIPTVGDVSCADLQLGADAGSVPEAQCPLLQGLVAAPCGCAPGTEPEPGTTEPEATAAPFVCNICGDGNTITMPDFVVNIPTVGDVSCADIQLGADAGTVPEAQCPLLQGLVAAPCGCAPAGTGPEPTQAPMGMGGPEPTPAPMGMGGPEPTLAPTPDDSSSSEILSYMYRFSSAATVFVFIADAFA